MIPAASTVSFVTGMWFVFDVAGTQVALWASAFSGKEEVYVAGQKVSEARRMRRASSHTIAVDGKDCTLDLSVVSHWRCQYACNLSHDGAVQQRQMTQFSRSPLEAVAWGVLLAVLFYVMLELDLGLWLGMGVLLALIALFMHALSRRAFAVVPAPAAAEPAGGS